MKSNKKLQELFIMNATGNLEKCCGIKMPHGKLLIDNPYYVKKIKQIEKRPDS